MDFIPQNYQLTTASYKKIYKMKSTIYMSEHELDPQ